MKLLQKLTPVAAGLLLSLGGVSAAQANDDFKLSEKLSVTGFIDMSYYYVDVDGASSESSSGLDQFEMDFLYSFDDKLNAQVDIEYQDQGDGEEEVDLEQAFITYAATDAITLKAGRFLSYSGWETEEPTGLFQYSGAGYAGHFYGGYQQGISAKYDADKFSVALSVVNDLYGEGNDSEDPAIEAMVAFMPSDTVTVKAFYMTDKLEGTSETMDLINIWASYSEGPLTLAAEFNTSENNGVAGNEADGFLLMGNYAFDNDFGLTLRYHDWEVENENVTTEEVSGFTISPSYVVSDNLIMVFEYRMDEINDVDVNSMALEALVTF